MSYSFKGPTQGRGSSYFFRDGSERVGQRRRGYRGGVKRDTRGEGGTGVTPAPLSQKRGLLRGRQRQHPCSWLVPCEALCFLSLPSEGLCFTRKQWQWPQLVRAKRCIQTGRGEKRREGGSNGRGCKGIARGGREGSGHVQNASSFRLTDVMPVPTVGEQRRDQGAPFSIPLHSLFFQDE